MTRASSHSLSLSSPRSKRVKRDETIKFSISEERGRRFKKILCVGLGKDEAKELSGQYSPKFHSLFVSDRLMVPSLDDAMYQRLSLVKQSKAGKGSIDLHERALYKINQRILDATKPLLFLSNEKLVDDDHRAAVATALALVADAFHGVTDARRHAVLRQTGPSFAFMLSTPPNFKKDEMEDLFGRSFIKEMVKSADTVKNLAKIGQSGNPAGRGGAKKRSLEQQYGAGPSGSSGYRHQHSFDGGSNHLGPGNGSGGANLGTPSCRVLRVGHRNRGVGG